MEVHYRYATEQITPAKPRKDVEARWTLITGEINALADGKAALTDDQVQKKWADLKSQSKASVMKYEKAMGKTGGGSN